MTLFENSEFDAMRLKETTELITLAGFKKADFEGCSCFTEFVEQLTPTKRKQALATVELYKRFLSKRDEQKQILSSKDIFTVMRPLLESLSIEEVWVIYLNQANKVIAQKRISVGGITETLADIRLILRYALQILSTNIALVHNHPSGNICPSTIDNKLTERVKKSAELLNIRLIDHIIIGGEKYFSYCDEGMI